MDFDLTLAAVLTAPGAAAAAIVVSTIVQTLKQLVPESWQHGRAPLLMALALSIALVALAAVDAALPMPGGVLTVILATLAVYGGAVGVHQTVSKTARVAAGTTNPTGPDAG